MNSMHDEGYGEGFNNGYDSGYSSGLSKGFDNGYDSGLSKGFDDGSISKTNEFVKSMISNGLNIDLISKITKLPKKEIETISYEQ